MFYLMTHSTYFIYGYVALDIRLTTTQIARGNPLPPLHGLLFPISSKGSFISTIPQTEWYILQPLLYQSWRLAGTRKSSMGPPQTSGCKVQISIIIIMYIFLQTDMYVIEDLFPIYMEVIYNKFGIAFIYHHFKTVPRSLLINCKW